MITINAPDGSQVQFPDGTDDATISGVMAKNYPVQQPVAPKPAAQPPAAKPAPQSSFGLGVDQGFVQPILNAGVGMEKATDAVGLPSVFKALGGHTASEIRDAHLKWLQAQQDPKSPINDAPGQSREPSLTGEIVGSLPSQAGTMVITRNPAASGAITGALNSTGNTPKEVATDAALGAGFSKAGDVGVRAIGSVVAPIWKGTVNKLLSEGVKLTPGQITGGVLHRLEDAAMSFPFVGDLIRSRSKEAEASFNIAGVNRALEPLGQQAPKNLPAGHAAIDYAQKQFDTAYGSILPKMKVSYDPQLHADVQGLLTHAQNEIPVEHQNALKGMSFKLAAAFNRGTTGGQPQITGETLKDLDTVFNGEISKFRTGNGFDQKYAAYVADMKQAFHDAMGRQNPGLQKQLAKVDQGYATLTTLERAAAPAAGGKFTPAGLNTATRTADPTIRKRASAAGRAKLQDLSAAGQDVMTRTVPDSGTAYRALVNTGAAALFAGAVPHAAVNPMALGGLAAVMAPYTKTGGNIVRAAITQRPAFAPALRRVVEKARIPASVVSARAALQAHNKTREP